MAPIRKGDGTPLEIPGVQEVRSGDGRVFFEGDAIPDSGNLQSHYVASELNADDGDTVSEWPDQVGSHDATGSATFVEDAINGQPALKFDGSDYFDTGYQQNTDDPRTLYIVAIIDASGSQSLWGGFDRDGDGNRSYLRYDSGDYSMGYADNETRGAGTEVGDWLIHSTVAADGSKTWHTNQTERLSGSYNAVGVISENDHIGAYLDDGDTTHELDGKIAEILRYDVEHGSSQRAEIEDYLDDKYDLL